MAPPLRRLAAMALRGRAVNDAVRRIAALRGRSLALVYHRVDPDGSAPRAVVPSLHEALFRRQVEALGELGEIVPLADLPGGRDRRRVRFALTFDDDYDTHAERVLPVLSGLGVQATFFLSGRSLHGLGPYWFEALESLIHDHGVDGAAERLGVSAGTPTELAIACQRDLRRQLLLERAAEQPADHLRADQIKELAAAAMTIGFHTLHHRPLTGLHDDAQGRALTEGRGELATVAGQPARLFAYPHGDSERRVASRVRAAGYTAAWTGLPNAMRPGDDPFLLGRWEPGPLALDDFLVQAAVRLHRRLPGPGA